MRCFQNGKLTRKENEIYHFLLPDKNMVPSAGIRMLKSEYPKEAKYVSDWRKEFIKPIRGDEFLKLQNICNKIDALLEEHYEIQNLINEYTGGKKNFFGHEDLQKEIFTAYNEKDHLAQQRNKHNAPYFKLKMVMDYWCALWFWDVRNAADLPTRSEWYADIANILELDFEKAIAREQEEGEDLIKLGPQQGSHFSEPKQLTFKTYRDSRKKEISIYAIKKYTDRTDLIKNNRLSKVNDLATQYRFFHNHLEFIEVFKQRGGFDIVVGNPPWVKLEFEEKGIISDYNPEVLIRNYSAPDIRLIVPKLLENISLKSLYESELLAAEALSFYLNSTQNYPLLKGQQGDLYKLVLVCSLACVNTLGYIGLIHPVSVYDDAKGEQLRDMLFKRLQYLFHFRNELKLFAETNDKGRLIFALNIYKGHDSDPNFTLISNLFHPFTIDGCFRPDSNGSLSIKVHAGNKFEWNLQSNYKRRIIVDKALLKMLSEAQDNIEVPKLIYLQSDTLSQLIKRISNGNGTNLSQTKVYYSRCFDETNDVGEDKILIDINNNTRTPDLDKYEFVYNGPHFTILNPIAQSPKKIYNSNNDYQVVDATLIDESFLPNTKYLPNYNMGFSHQSVIFEKVNWYETYRWATRAMVGPNSERTLQGAIIPPKSIHINGVLSIAFENELDLLSFSALTASIILDFYVKVNGWKNIHPNSIKKLPLGNEYLNDHAKVRVLLLNCLNKYYTDLWERNWSNQYNVEYWSKNDFRLKSFSEISQKWNWKTPLRNHFERRQALLEIDVIMAIQLGLSLEELLLIYEIQFPVLQENENETFYDQKGNIVFTCSKSLVGVGLDRHDWERVKDKQEGDLVTHTITKSELYRGKQVTYYPPFTKCDRVEDYKQAWAFFEEKFSN